MVADVLINKGEVLGEAGQGLHSLTAYHEVIRRFGDSPDPELREQVARAMNKLARAGEVH